ncbi:MAG: phosphotyrosine protein phosphatase [Proteobacteria bacterium]|nr:phosphotyrosine protein phosphatase [Pseudomonadota bacterium]
MNKKAEKISTLFVCMGNYCRSPAAEAIANAIIGKRKLEHFFFIDSAGTVDHHIGSPPDLRMREEGRKRGYDLSKIRARQVANIDFDIFDYILVMDFQNIRDLSRINKSMTTEKVRLLASHINLKPAEIPDPYSGGEREFTSCFALIEKSVTAFFDSIFKKMNV